MPRGTQGGPDASNQGELAVSFHPTRGSGFPLQLHGASNNWPLSKSSRYFAKSVMSYCPFS